MTKITRAAYKGDYRVELDFSTGETATVDLSELIQRPGSMVAPLREAAAFRGFFLELGALAWSNGFELSPEAVYRKAREAGVLRRGRAA